MIVQLASKSLWETEGKPALTYLTEKRGLLKPVIKDFGIGYVPQYVNLFLNGRIIYPIRDCYGNLVAVSTRHLFKPKKESFWHEEFEKSLHLFGIHIAKKAMIKHHKAVVVEGELDTLALQSFGIPMTVGLCGGAFGIFQMALLARYCNEVYLLLDPDSSGKSNTGKTIEKMKELVTDLKHRGILLIPCNLPGGYDPDDFAREFGKDGIIEMMKTEKQRYLA